MKVRTLILILCLPIVLEAKLPTPTPEMAPPRTKQQDLELRDWITGMMKETELAKADATSARSHSTEVEARLVTAQAQLGTIQKLYDALVKEVQDLRNKLAKAMKLLGDFSWIIGLAAAAITLLLCLWLKVPFMSPPAGIIATCALPILALGIIKVLPHL